MEFSLRHYIRATTSLLKYILKVSTFYGQSRQLGSYQLWFNNNRPNTYKGNKTPLQLILVKKEDINTKVTRISPVALDTLFRALGDNDVFYTPLSLNFIYFY